MTDPFRVTDDDLQAALDRGVNALAAYLPDEALIETAVLGLGRTMARVEQNEPEPGNPDAVAAMEASRAFLLRLQEAVRHR
jgi:hypothetical protein